MHENEVDVCRKTKTKCIGPKLFDAKCTRVVCLLSFVSLLICHTWYRSHMPWFEFPQDDHLCRKSQEYDERGGEGSTVGQWALLERAGPNSQREL